MRRGRRMIISASRRTDIPSCYPEWFVRRLQQGFVYVRSPFDAHRLSKVALTPDVVDCIAFWTKNPLPLMPYLDRLEPYPYFFLFTLTGYGRNVEPGVPDKADVMIPAFQQLADRIGPDRVIWRYDPIFFTDTYTMAYHVRAFRAIAEALRGCTHTCIISFLDRYRSIEKALEEMGAHVEGGRPLREFARQLGQIAADNGIRVRACAEEEDFSDVGIVASSCIDAGMVERLVGERLDVHKDPAQRPLCHCVASIDIGAYSTCTNGCRYCYANRGAQQLRKNLKRFDPASPVLCDTVRPDDEIVVRPMRSLRTGQTALNFGDVPTSVALPFDKSGG